MGFDQTAYALRHTIETLRAPADARMQRDTVAQSLAFAHNGQLKRRPAAPTLDGLSFRMGSRAAVAADCLPDNIVRYQTEHDADSEPAALAPAVRDVIVVAAQLKRKLAVMRAARDALDNLRLRDLFRSSTPCERALSDALFAVADAYLALEATLGVAHSIIEMIDMPQLPMSPIERLMHGFAPAGRGRR